MPKVEQYGAPKVATQIATEARASDAPAGAFGGAIAQGVSQLGQGMAQLKMKIDTAAAEEALVKFERDKNDIFFNPKSGYFNTQGRNAYDSAGATSEALDKLKRQYSESLKSDTARNAFSRAADQHISRSQQDIMRHASKGIRAWEVATIKASVENTLENATLYWNDSERSNVQRQLGRQSVMDAAKLEGIDSEALNERLQTYESAFAMSGIEAALSSSAADAEQLFGKVRDRLEGPDLLRAEGLIAKRKKIEHTQSVASQAVLVAGSMVDKHGDADNARAAILEEVNALEDGELRKAATTEAMKQLGNRQKAVSEERGALFEQGESFIMEGGTVEQFKAQNPDAWEKLTTKQKRTLNNGDSIETDYMLLSDLMTLPKTKLAQVNPTDHFSSLAKSDRQKLISAVASARNGGVDHQVGRTRSAETSATLEQLFGKRNKWGTEDKEKVNAFHSIINDEVETREKQKGAPLTSEEYTDVLNGMTRKVVKERKYWFDKKVDLTDLPAADLKVLSDFLRKNNIPVTTDNLIKAHTQASK